MTIEHTPWPKIPRLNREMTITEKIDGTNAAVGIERLGSHYTQSEAEADGFTSFIATEDEWEPYLVYAQSRKKIITVGQDNAGFARYVHENAAQLVAVLGDGLHFGEWWGSGINRNYGLPKGEKRFSLFNTLRYGKEEFDLTQVPGLSTVPVLYRGAFDSATVRTTVNGLAQHGSVASPGFMSPEGVIVFHMAARLPFKVTIEDDEKPKGSTE
jgi:hypothetical protein